MLEPARLQILLDRVLGAMEVDWMIGDAPSAEV